MGIILKPDSYNASPLLDMCKQIYMKVKNFSLLDINVEIGYNHAKYPVLISVSVQCIMYMIQYPYPKNPGLAIVQFAALFFLPRTPHFLVLRNEDEEATRVLRRLGRTGSVRQELANIRNSSRHASNSTCSQLFSSQVSTYISRG
mgnify:CR=1 FL=1